MKNLSRVLLLISVLLPTGCSMLAKLQTESAQEVAKGVIKYCTYTEEVFRIQFRSEINSILEPKDISIEVDCSVSD